jgi:hypothetical protein
MVNLPLISVISLATTPTKTKYLVTLELNSDLVLQPAHY